MNTPEIIIDSSGKGRKVWKSEVIGPAVIVDTGSQGWGQVLLEVLESSTSTFQTYKYKYSQYLDSIKYIKYFFNQVQVQVQSTLVTNNSTISLDPKLIYNYNLRTYSSIKKIQICTQNHVDFMKSTMDG